MSDNINPEHYQGGIECIDAIEEALTPEEFVGFCKGNVFKYLWRCNEKGGIEDLQKAKWYLDRLIEAETQSDLQSMKDYPFGEPDDSIPDGWRELEPKEIPSKGDKFWIEGCEWVELLHNGTVEYSCCGAKFIRKVEPPKPAFAVGDRVKVCKPGSLLDGRVGEIDSFLDDEKILILRGYRSGVFQPSELQPVEAGK